MECIRQIWEWFLSPLVSFFSILAGSFSGAYFAFKYQRHAEKLKQREDRISALKIAQASIHSHWASLKEIHEFLAANKSDLAKKHLNLRDIIRVRSIIPLNVQSIAFLLDGKHANLVQDLTLVEGASASALAGMQHRSELIRKLQDDSTQTRIVHPQQARYSGEMDAVTGTLFVQLTESTEESAKDACENAEKAFFALKAAGEEIFGVPFPTLVDEPPEVKA